MRRHPLAAAGLAVVAGAARGRRRFVPAPATGGRGFARAPAASGTQRRARDAAAGRRRARARRWRRCSSSASTGPVPTRRSSQTLRSRDWGVVVLSAGERRSTAPSGCSDRRRAPRGARGAAARRRSSPSPRRPAVPARGPRRLRRPAPRAPRRRREGGRASSGAPGACSRRTRDVGGRRRAGARARVLRRPGAWRRRWSRAAASTAGIDGRRRAGVRALPRAGRGVAATRAPARRPSALVARRAARRAT